MLIRAHSTIVRPTIEINIRGTRTYCEGFIVRALSFIVILGLPIGHNQSVTDMLQC